MAEQVTAAELIGIPASDVPAPRSLSWRRYFEAIRPELARDTGGPGRLRLIVLPPMPTWVRYLTRPSRPGAGWPRRGRAAAAVGPADVLPAGAGLTDAAATAGLRAFRQTMLRSPSGRPRSPIVWGGYERVAAARRPERQGGVVVLGEEAPTSRGPASLPDFIGGSGGIAPAALPPGMS